MELALIVFPAAIYFLIVGFDSPPLLIVLSCTMYMYMYMYVYTCTCVFCMREEMYVYTVEPTLIKGHICIGIHQPICILPLKEDNLSIMDKMIHPNVSSFGGSIVY